MRPFPSVRSAAVLCVGVLFAQAAVAATDASRLDTVQRSRVVSEGEFLQGLGLPAGTTVKEVSLRARAAWGPTDRRHASADSELWHETASEPIHTPWLVRSAVLSSHFSTCGLKLPRGTEIDVRWHAITGSHTPDYPLSMTPLPRRGEVSFAPWNTAVEIFDGRTRVLCDRGPDGALERVRDHAPRCATGSPDGSPRPEEADDDPGNPLPEGFLCRDRPRLPTARHGTRSPWMVTAVSPGWAGSSMVIACPPVRTGAPSARRSPSSGRTEPPVRRSSSGQRPTPASGFPSRTD